MIIENGDFGLGGERRPVGHLQRHVLIVMTERPRALLSLSTRVASGRAGIQRIGPAEAMRRTQGTYCFRRSASSSWIWMFSFFVILEPISHATQPGSSGNEAKVTGQFPVGVRRRPRRPMSQSRPGAASMSVDGSGTAAKASSSANDRYESEVVSTRMNSPVAPLKSIS